VLEGDEERVETGEMRRIELNNAGKTDPIFVGVLLHILLLNWFHQGSPSLHITDLQLRIGSVLHLFNPQGALLLALRITGRLSPGLVLISTGVGSLVVGGIGEGTCRLGDSVLDRTIVAGRRIAEGALESNIFILHSLNYIIIGTNFYWLAISSLYLVDLISFYRQIPIFLL
jgi:hypothetical protein